MLLDDVLGIKVVHADLWQRHPLGRVTETRIHTDLLASAPGGGSQRGKGNSTEGGGDLRPGTIYVHPLTDGTIR